MYECDLNICSSNFHLNGCGQTSASSPGHKYEYGPVMCSINSHLYRSGVTLCSIKCPHVPDWWWVWFEGDAAKLSRFSHQTFEVSVSLVNLPLVYCKLNHVGVSHWRIYLVLLWDLVVYQLQSVHNWHLTCNWWSPCAKRGPFAFYPDS